MVDHFKFAKPSTHSQITVKVPTANIVLANISAITPHVCNRTSLAGNANAHMSIAIKQAKFAVTIPGEFCMIQSDVVN